MQEWAKHGVKYRTPQQGLRFEGENGGPVKHFIAAVWNAMIQAMDVLCFPFSSLRAMQQQKQCNRDYVLSSPP